MYVDHATGLRITIYVTIPSNSEVFRHDFYTENFQSFCVLLQPERFSLFAVYIAQDINSYHLAKSHVNMQPLFAEHLILCGAWFSAVWLATQKVSLTGPTRGPSWTPCLSHERRYQERN